MHGQRVLVVDLDPHGNASTALATEHRGNVPSIYQVLVDDLPLGEIVKEVPDMPGLYCAPATIALAGAEIELVSLVAREARLTRALRAFDSIELDYIFVDCPPSLGLLTVNALAAANRLIVPVQCEYYALEGLAQLLESVERIRGAINPGLALTGLLLTMYDRRTRLSGDVEREVRTHFGPKVFSSVVPRSVRLAEAPSHGLPITQYDRNSRSADAYYRLALEVVERG